MYQVYVDGVLYATDLAASCMAAEYGCRCVFCIQQKLQKQRRVTTTVRI